MLRKFILNIIISIGLVPLFSHTFGQKALIDSLNQKAYETYRENLVEGKQLAYRALSLAKKDKLIPQMVDSYINLSRCFRLESN